MNIVTGVNLKVPDGRVGHYVRARVFKDGKVEQKFFNITERGEEKALSLAKEWYKDKKK